MAPLIPQQHRVDFYHRCAHPKALQPGIVLIISFLHLNHASTYYTKTFPACILSVPPEHGSITYWDASVLSKSNTHPAQRLGPMPEWKSVQKAYLRSAPYPRKGQFDLPGSLPLSPDIATSISSFFISMMSVYARKSLSFCSSSANRYSSPLVTISLHRRKFPIMNLNARNISTRNL